MTDNIKPCPFCGHSEVLYFNGWFGGSEEKQVEHKKKGKAIDGDGREPTIVCDNDTGGCGMGASYGWYGQGISDEEVRKQNIEAWNRRV